MPTHEDKPRRYLDGPADPGPAPVDWHDPYREAARRRRAAAHGRRGGPRRPTALVALVLASWLFAAACAAVYLLSRA